MNVTMRHAQSYKIGVTPVVNLRNPDKEGQTTCPGSHREEVAARALARAWDINTHILYPEPTQQEGPGAELSKPFLKPWGANQESGACFVGVRPPQARLLSLFGAYSLDNPNPLLRRKGRDFSWTNEIFHLLSKFIKPEKLSILSAKIDSFPSPLSGLFKNLTLLDHVEDIRKHKCREGEREPFHFWAGGRAAANESALRSLPLVI